MTTPLIDKSIITELKAAAQSSEQIFRRAQAEWPVIYQRFKVVLGDRFQVENERMAPFDLALAAIALDLQAVKNLFPFDQAKRIEGWVEKIIDTQEFGEYAVNEVKAYGQQFQNEVETIKNGGDPIMAIPIHLLSRWLGKDIRNFEVEIDGKKTGFIDPILLAMTAEILIPFVGTWKSIKDQYKLVEEDLPTNFNWEAQGLYDLGTYPDDRKPDETVIFSDSDGKITERWLHPKKLMKLLFGSGAKRVGTVCRVMVKGPWKGIKETTMQLSDESVNAFVDEHGRAYAFCIFKKGRPEFKLIKKTVWEKLDQAEAIMSNTQLTDIQQMAALKRLLED